MLSNKVITTFIICFSLVLSFWLVSRTPPKKSIIVTAASSTVSGVSSEDTFINSNDDWKKILSNVSPANENYLNLTTNKSSSASDPKAFDDTTLTAQMARDVFSRYLSVANTNGPLSSDQAQQISDDTLSVKDYTQVTGVVYVKLNLHIINQNTPDDIKKYKTIINAAVATSFNETNKEPEPMAVVNYSTQTGDETYVSKLDPDITTAKKLINSLVNMEVPSQAIDVHLAVLNAGSKVLADIEAMRNMYTDPVKGLNGISQYQNDMSNLVLSLSNLNKFFVQRLGS